MKKKNVIKSVVVSLMMLLSWNVKAQDKSIVETAMSSEDFTTLVAAVKAADLVDVLSSKGPFTVFAPTNSAFAKLPEGTVEGLLKPESKETLQTVLKYHVVAGSVMASDVVAMIKKSNGKAMIETVSGNKLTAQMKDGAVYLVDENKNWSKIEATDMKTSNGVIHVIDSVLLPK
ncbi:fasciclin domain-containing protein [Bizionia myxarmorum]|uniref:Fasciclin domain-containing protein n=1 Tax=Bizionia myxarmorum TaxID=291186 RepID=A0A5D0R6E7_9FLAO|nr:fasciclin domain-containing protein [Bizionia myxarmorum]